MSDGKEIGDRIRQIRLKAGATLDAFAAELGVHRNTQFKYEKGDRLPDSAYLQVVCDKFSVDGHWLLTGRHSAEERPTVPPGVAEDLELIPMYDVGAAAGHGAVVEWEEVMDVVGLPAHYVRHELRLTPRNLCFLVVQGESMEPTMRRGDLILVDRGATTLGDGVFVLRFGDALVVKRTARIAATEIRLRGDNEAWPEQVIDLSRTAEDFAVVGRVVAILKWI